MQPPCYNVKEKKDCNNRSGLCRCTCSEWAEYEIWRTQEYAKKEKLRQFNENAMDVKTKKHNKAIKKGWK